MNNDIGENFVERMEAKKVAIEPGTSYLGRLGVKNINKKKRTYSREIIAENIKKLNASNKFDLNKCSPIIKTEENPNPKMSESFTEREYITVPNPFAFAKKKIASGEIGRVRKGLDIKKLVLNPFAKNLAKTSHVVKKVQRNVLQSVTNFAGENGKSYSYSTHVQSSTIIYVEDDEENVNEQEDTEIIPANASNVTEQERENINPTLSREETIQECLQFLLGDDENESSSESECILIEDKSNSEVNSPDFESEARKIEDKSNSEVNSPDFESEERKILRSNVQSKAMMKKEKLRNGKDSEGPPNSSNNTMKNALSSSKIQEGINKLSSRALYRVRAEKRKSQTQQMPCEINRKRNNNPNGHFQFHLDEQTHAPFVSLTINFNGNNYCGQGANRNLACIDAAQQIMDTIQSNAFHNMMSHSGINVRRFYSGQHGWRNWNVGSGNRFSQTSSNFHFAGQSMNRNAPWSARDEQYFYNRRNYHVNETPNWFANIPSRQVSFQNISNGNNFNNGGNNNGGNFWQRRVYRNPKHI